MQKKSRLEELFTCVKYVSTLTRRNQVHALRLIKQLFNCHLYYFGEDLHLSSILHQVSKKMLMMNVAGLRVFCIVGITKLMK